MKNRLLNKLKSIFPLKIVEPIPPELHEEYGKIQLENSIRRIRILTIIALSAKLINAIFNYLTNEHLQAGGLFDLFDYSELAVIIVFNLSTFFFRNSRKNILWIVCYLVIAGFYILYEFSINSTGRIEQIPFIFFVTIFLFSFLPDFKPSIFISFAIIYFIFTIFILMTKNQDINEYFGVQSHILNIFIIIIVTKILLYNSKVRTFINTHQINKLNDELSNANVELKNAIMETMAELVECRDGSTGEHISRTSKFLKILIDAMLEKGIYSDQTESWKKNADQIILSAQLHDVGKISIDDSILRKPGKLTDEEFNIMKKHTIFGGEIIKKIQKKTTEKEFLENANTFAVYHHEKWNGSGYPHGIAGEEIPLLARLMAIIDVYDALTSERPYKKAFTHEEAVNIIRDGRATHFDPVLTDLFLSVSDRFII